MKPSKPDLSPGEKVTIGAKYGYAMEVADKAEATAYLEECVAHCMSFGKTREEALAIEKSNIGYYAGYGWDRARIEELYECAHPVFGSVKENGHPSFETALGAGLARGKAVSQ